MNQTLSRFVNEGAASMSEVVRITTPFFGALRPVVQSLTGISARVAMGAPSDISTKGPEHHTADDAALASLSLLAAGLALDAGVPDTARWRLKGYVVDCKQDRMEAPVVATADASNVTWSAAGEYQVPVQLVLEHNGDLVATNTLTIAVEVK